MIGLTKNLLPGALQSFSDRFPWAARGKGVKAPVRRPRHLEESPRLSWPVGADADDLECLLGNSLPAFCPLYVWVTGSCTGFPQEFHSCLWVRKGVAAARSLPVGAAAVGIVTERLCRLEIIPHLQRNSRPLWRDGTHLPRSPWWPQGSPCPIHWRQWSPDSRPQAQGGTGASIRVRPRTVWAAANPGGRKPRRSPTRDTPALLGLLRCEERLWLGHSNRVILAVGDSSVTGTIPVSWQHGRMTRLAPRGPPQACPPDRFCSHRSPFSSPPEGFSPSRQGAGAAH